MIEAFKEIFILEKNILDGVPPEEKANVLSSVAKILEQKRKEKKQRQEAITRSNSNDTEEKKAEAMLAAAKRSNETNESAMSIVEAFIKSQEERIREEMAKKRSDFLKTIEKKKKESPYKEIVKKSLQPRLEKSAPAYSEINKEVLKKNKFK